ncbi:hypothetical protein PRMUPPPA20_25350 [Xylanibacter ruminicola]|uniref:Uncharacterized protein n=1 Tax=Xylanibacter ruminicola TaxID=839 RepID=A0AA37I9C7_XYLRU|nr:hypothetical protein PRMUPPPA20_25350 [Xylanibacter ruminicola]
MYDTVDNTNHIQARVTTTPAEIEINNDAITVLFLHIAKKIRIEAITPKTL